MTVHDGETVTEQADFAWNGPVLIGQATTAPALPDPVTLTRDHDGFTPRPDRTPH